MESRKEGRKEGKKKKERGKERKKKIGGREKKENPVTKIHNSWYEILRF